jgi:DNA-binding CsgD family transcriptional regulator
MERDVLNTISEIYEAANQPTTGPLLEVCDRIAGMLNARADGLTVLDTTTCQLRAVESNIDPQIVKDYVDHFQTNNEIQIKIAALDPGGRFNRAEFIDDAAFEKTAIYNEFFRKADIFNFEYRVIAAPGDLQAAIEFSRPKGRGNFSKKDHRLMDRLVPHLGKAFGVHFNYFAGGPAVNVLTEALDRIPRGILIIDESRRVLFSNTSGSSILSNGDGIFVNRRGSISARNNADHKRLKASLAGVFGSRGGGDGWASTIRLQQGSGKKPLELLISRCMKGDCDQFGTGEKAIIFVTDPESRRVSLAGVLCELYGLTRSEARVASLAVDGMSLHEIADELFISENTVRTHMKRIYAKTDTRRQSELARLVLSGPASLRFDEERKI